MIVAVCSDKGAPGVSTLAVSLAMVWPVAGGATVLEADPSGGDLTFWTRPITPPGAQFLAAEPSVLTLAADIRTSLAHGIHTYGQVTTLGVRVIPGPLRAEAAGPMRSMWPGIAQQAAAWQELAPAARGRAPPAHPAGARAPPATVVLLAGRPTVEGLYRLRERSAQLASALGDTTQQRNPVGVVVVAKPKTRKEAIGQVEHMLGSAGSPIPVAGWMADEPGAADALRSGQVTSRLSGSALLRSVRELADTMTSWWPALQSTLQPPDQPGQPGQPGQPRGRRQPGQPGSAGLNGDAHPADQNGQVPPRRRVPAFLRSQGGSP